MKPITGSVASSMIAARYARSDALGHRVARRARQLRIAFTLAITQSVFDAARGPDARAGRWTGEHRTSGGRCPAPAGAACATGGIASRRRVPGRLPDPTEECVRDSPLMVSVTQARRSVPPHPLPIDRYGRRRGRAYATRREMRAGQAP